MAVFDLPQLCQCVPTRWFAAVDETSTVMYSAYRCILPPMDQFALGLTLDLGDAVVGFLWGEPWAVTGDTRLIVGTGADGSLQLTAPTGTIGSIPTGAWVLVIQPLKTGDPATAQTDEQARSRRQQIAAILSASISTLLTFDLAFENTAWLRHPTQSLGRTLGGFAVTREHFASPYLSQERLNAVQELDEKMRQLPVEDRFRFENALRWFDLGNRTNGIERFVNLWVALEALVLRDTSNIGPLKGSVARAYNISEGSATHKFGLGRLLRLRSLILHGQVRVEPQINMMSFLAALFVDVARESLGLPCERRAEEALQGPDFDRSNFIDEATAKLMKK